ncbi:uncharacterized protein LOC143186457 [Calliopsis andreniformis]|uniref:uncharacterized protein LOC143186457 n=1 Tax=Calliopsis andreniformis TaxID=337506 RepID=UPI003FCDAEAB
MLISTSPTLSCLIICTPLSLLRGQNEWKKRTSECKGLSIEQSNLSRDSDSDLVLQKTQLGCVIGESVPVMQHRSRKAFVTNVNFDLRKFWEIEEGPFFSHHSAEEEACETHFVTHKQCVRESRLRALNRSLRNIVALGHMSQSLMFFDVSAKSSSGISLNDTQLIGPTIQDDVFSPLARFRMHAYVIIGDIETIYQQFLVRQEDPPTFELNTVTFGLSSAPFLAIKCLHQLADDKKDIFPTAAGILKKDLYVDDLLMDADTYNDALTLQIEIIKLLKRGELNIRQWISNEPLLLLGLAEDQIHLKQLKLDWDESHPTNFHTKWIAYEKELQHLNDVSEHHVTQHAVRRIELYGFCDASERVYGACSFVRSIDERGHVVCHLLCAKSRVAPLKTVTLARLELCSALLLANLYASVLLKRLWQTVSQTYNQKRILTLALQLAHNSLWCHGLPWLTDSETNWPKSRFEISLEVPELRKITCFTTSTVNSEEILQRFSCINKLRRIVAYCFRILRKHRNNVCLTVEEINQANERIIKLVQASAFATDMQNLSSGAAVYAKSKLLSLSPFLDEKAILRIGGRLQNSNLNFNQKHPILLPKNHHVTDLIIRQAHLDNCHAGINSILYTVTLKY